MKVKDLIKMLLEYPMDNEVVIGYLNRELHSLNTQQIICCDQYLSGSIIIVGEPRKEEEERCQ